MVDQSLQRMQTDYIDVLLVHYPDKNTPFAETMGALDSVVQQGKVRAVGLSNFTLDWLKECQAIRPIDVVQYHLNLFDRRMEQEIIPYCQQQGIGVMAWSPLGSGLLAGAYTEDHKFGERDWRGTGDVGEIIVGMYTEEVFARNVRLVDDLKPIASQQGQDNASACLEMGLGQPAP